MSEWVDSQLADDVVLPVQFYDRSTQRSGIQRLAFAVLVDALHSAAARQSNKSEVIRIQREAQFWIDDASAEGEFSFNWVCDLLGLDASALRARLKRSDHDWIHTKTRCRQVVVKTRPSTRPNRRERWR